MKDVRVNRSNHSVDMGSQQARFSPREVASAIGVSESSVKRWCDQGQLSYEKTGGGHRRIPLSSVVEFVRQQSFEMTRPELLGLPPRGGGRETDVASSRERLVSALVQGELVQARRLVVDLYLGGSRIADLCDLVVAEAFHQIGDLWDCNAVEVYHERRACEIFVRIIHDLRLMLPPPPTDAPLAMGGTPSGDHYLLPNLMVELVLRQCGFEVMALGSNLPLATIEVAVRDHRPQLIWLSVSHLSNAEAFIREYAEFQARVADLGPLVVGGQALTTEIRTQMTFASFCDNLRQLESFAQNQRRHALPSPT